MLSKNYWDQEMVNWRTEELRSNRNVNGVAFIIKKLGKRRPLRVLFGLTMGIGAYMSVAFIGNAVRSFQEADYIHTTPMIGIIPRLDINIASMTGIHPTLESTVAQLILLAVYAVGPNMYW